MKFLSMFTCMCIALLSLATLSACSTVTSPGEIMQGQGIGTATLADQWIKGESMVKDGEKLVRKGKSKVDDGEDMIDDGEGMIKEGKTLMRESERDYRKRGMRELDK